MPTSKKPLQGSPEPLVEEPEAQAPSPLVEVPAQAESEALDADHEWLPAKVRLNSWECPWDGRSMLFSDPCDVCGATLVAAAEQARREKV